MARASAALLVLLLCGCSAAGATTTPDEPRRFGDYDGGSNPVDDQCGLPVEERTGGWFCFGSE